MSLCAAILKRFLAHAAQRVGNGVAVSTRRVAMCARHILDELGRAVLLDTGLPGALRRGLAYLLEEAAVIGPILRHLGVPTEIPAPRPARAPPVPRGRSQPEWGRRDLGV